MKTFQEAKTEAMKVIEKLYLGNKMNCCISETKLSKNAKKSFYGFRFHSQDTNNQFVLQKDLTYVKLTRI